MASWAFPAAQRYATLGVDAAASTGTTVTASGTINTKGSWSQLTASTAFDVSHLQVFVRADTAFAGYLVDIGIGGAGSETVLIPDLLVQSRTDAGYIFQFPLAVPAGTRVSARCQSTTVSATCRVAVVAAGSPWGLHVPCSRVVAMGVDTADTGSTVTVEPGAVANAKGSWVEVTSATSAPFRGLVPAVGGRGNTALSDADYLLDIGIGGSGSETVLIADMPQRAGAASDFFSPGTYPLLPVDLPAGVRIAARAQSSITDASDRVLELALYGVV